jgi:hypothetical protein
MLPVAAPRAVLHVKGSRIAMVAVVAAVATSATANHARCTPLPVQVVGMRRRYLSSHEKTGLCIAAIVTSRKALAAQMTADLAGNPHE